MVKAKDEKNRMLEIFYRAMVGGNINTKALADEYGVSGKSISRDIGEIKNFLSDNRDLVNYKDLRYSASSKTYHLEFDHVLLSKELIAIIKVLIGCRAFSKEELLTLISKLKAFTSHQDRALLDQIITKEVYHYNEVGRDCESVIDNLWKLTRCIKERQEISISYYKVDREPVERRIMPIAITFSDYYFYLIAYRCDTEDWTPLYFRVDRITHITEHRTHFTLAPEHDFDVGKLRDKIQFMFPGKLRKIKFSYTGDSVQAILDRIPTARVLEQNGKTSILEAETFGTGINMFLLSQGRKIKALGPPEFVDEIREEISDMDVQYKE